MLKANKGFTLLELLVSLAIFSLVAITAYGSIASMISTREHLEEDSRQLQALQTAWRIIGRDIEQAADRPVRSEYEEELPSMSWTNRPEILALTANGRRNPTGMARSGLQRVAFRLDGSRLVKDSWPVLDRSIETRPFSQVILEGIEGFDVSFIDKNERVLRTWPPPEDQTGATQSLPRAVNIQLEIRNWGRIDRLFLVSGSS